ncbi:hypothetical protein [Actinomadura flavalba]|uniref:hypothetical protein n=1 Tax=Actinomadura flavalba TaxID=1120938 RepID=UPI0003657AF9|nr:hypothetical protein [Actinomadura flavalba]
MLPVRTLPVAWLPYEPPRPDTTVAAAGWLRGAGVRVVGGAPAPGGIPHRSQYPSWTCPPHPGCVHRAGTGGAAGPDAPCGADG